MRILRNYVDSGAAAGVSAKVTHKGRELFRGAAGYADIETQRPFSCDDVVRIFSLSKMIYAVAALQLFEQGFFTLEDPVYKFVPAFKDAKVLSYFGKDIPTVRYAKKDITMRHLFTMTAGFAYPEIAVTAETPRRYMDAAAYSEKVFAQALEERDLGMELTTRRMLEAIATIPMCFEPGEGFIYGLSADILGGVTACISGTSLGETLRDGIFEPLGMKDTTFTPNGDQKKRMAVIYNVSNPAVPVPYDFSAVKSSIQKKDSPLEICVGGLYSTLDDYSGFMQMLAAGGTLNGNRVLGRKTVELMTMDQLTGAQYDDFKKMWAPRGNASWGLMTRVTTGVKDSPHAFFPGTFGWGGAAGCLAVADKSEELTVTMMTQRVPSGDYGLINRLMQAAYASVD
jgi:CubicO group peptidase (beta-lactamase class C family)